jgi:hypothetical protein
MRPWFLSAEGYLMVLFETLEEAQRAQRGLLEHGLPQEDTRLYTSEQMLSSQSRLAAERSALAKAVFAVTADPPTRRRYLDTAGKGGAALWLFAPSHDDAHHLVRLLADYDHLSVRYYGDDGPEDILRPNRHGDTGQLPG